MTSSIPMKMIASMLATVFCAMVTSVTHAHPIQESEIQSAESDARGDRPRESDQHREDQSDPTAAPAQAIGYTGTFMWSAEASLVRAVGLIGQSAAGDRVFEIELPNAERTRFSLTMLPSNTLERMEQSIVEGEEPPRFEVTGTVHTFDGHLYLLPVAAHRVIRSAEFAAPPDRDPPPVAPRDDAVSAPPDDIGSRSIEDIIAGVERDVPVGRSLPPTQPEPGSSQAETELSVPYDDGVILMARRGRVSRGPAGEWQFSFAADAAGLSDPPMTLLPCELLETIRARVASADEVFFIVSGRVYRYGGRAFFMPAMVRADDTKGQPNLRGR